MHTSHFSALGLCVLVGLLAQAGGVSEETESSKIVPPSEMEFLNFGRALAIGDGKIVVGADSDSINGNIISSVYVYDSSSGNFLFELDPGAGREGKGFGRSVAIGDGYIAVGADIGPGPGSVFVFKGDSGALLRELVPENGSSWDRFGYSIAIDDGQIAIGAIWEGPFYNGAAYVFDLDTGTQLRKQIEAWPFYGWDVDLKDGILGVSAIVQTNNSNGRVYLYDNTSGALTHTLSPGINEQLTNFGQSISIDNGKIAIGAWSDDENDQDSGAAYLFDTTSGGLITKVLPHDGRATDYFGWDVDLERDVLVVGSPVHWVNGNDRSGSAYLFDANTGASISEIFQSDGSQSDRFGTSVALGEGIAAVGAWGDENAITDSGSVYTFQLECAPDLNGDGSVNFFDLSIFLNRFNSQDPLADMNGDGSWNFFDVSLYLNQFNSGCP